jgi:thioredoxin-dependent peroxiredoxin
VGHLFLGSIIIPDRGHVRMWIIAAIVVGVIAVVVGSRLLSAKSAPVAGSSAPDFTLSSQVGKEVSLKDYRGKWVVLYFYPKDFTSGCTIEAHNFQRDQEEYARRNAVILGISVDSAESHKQFCAKEGLNFKLLADTSHEVSKQYGSLMNFGIAQISARHTFLIDPHGKIARSYMSVNPSRHSAEMLAALDELEPPSQNH